jgi:hypothetical protein
VAAVYLAAMLAATLSSGRAILGLWLPPEYLGLWLPPEYLGLGHVPLFAGLCLVLLWAVRGPRRPRLWAVTIFCLLFAGFDEWAQRFVPDRVPELKDFAANAAGVGLGLAVGVGFIKGAPAVSTLRRGGSTR